MPGWGALFIDFTFEQAVFFNQDDLRRRIMLTVNMTTIV
jgi:hypothetical protein